MKKTLEIGLLGATLLLGGCHYSVNLITQRRNYESYGEMVSRAQALSKEKAAFYREAMGQVSDADQSPYPSLDNDLQAMEQAIHDMTGTQNRIREFEQKYDRFAAGRSVINSDDEQEWGKFKGLQAEFSPLAGAMNAGLAAFNRASGEFDSLCGQYHVAKASAADLRRDIGAGLDALDHAMPEMEGRLEGKRKSLRGWANASADPEAPKKKRETLERMETVLASQRDLRKGAIQNGVSALKALPQGGMVWTGPGAQAEGVGAFFQARDNFNKGLAEFDSLSNRFEEIGRAQPQH